MAVKGDRRSRAWDFSRTPVVLVIDDSKSETMILRSLLSKKGVEVHCLNSGKAAFETVESLDPDLILLDVVLPDLNGFDFCARLKDSSATKDIPVVFLTSLDRREDVMEGYRAGGSDYVTKPFRSEELLARVGVHLELAVLHSERLKQTGMLARSEQRLQRLSLADGLAHNLNNLLAPLMGNLNWLKDVLEEGEPLQVVDEMIEIVERLDRVAGSLTGRSQQAMQTLEELGPLLSDFVKRFRLGLADEVTLETAFNPEDRHRVSSQLETVLMALLANAQEAITGEGAIRLVVEYRAEDRMVDIVIEDNGKGLAEEVAAKAFLPFYSTKNTVGTGLGLHTAQLIVERMGGSIELQNRPEGGARAVVRLPLEEERARATVRLPLDAYKDMEKG